MLTDSPRQTKTGMVGQQECLHGTDHMPIEYENQSNEGRLDDREATIASRFGHDYSAISNTAASVSMMQPGSGRIFVQRATTGNVTGTSHENGVAQNAHESVRKANSSAGNKLPQGIHQDLEAFLAASLDNVRVHTSVASEQAADDVGARAFTIGREIHFRREEYDPYSNEGRHLIAHEVVHTLQQAGGATRPQYSLQINPADDRTEVEADAVADAFISDIPVSKTLASNLTRTPITLARVGGWSSDPRVGTQNKDSQKLGNVERIPLQGLSNGLQSADVTKETNESANQRAIAVVPSSVDFTKKVDVLLHLHGHNVGYRERIAAHNTSGASGTVRDIEADQIEQQLDATSYKNIIGLLPQGSTGSKFGTFNADAYVTDALTKLGNTMNPNVTIQRGKVILSGHSGGGPDAVRSATVLNPASVPQGDDPFAKDSPLLLFDGINGINQMDAVKKLVGGWIDSDIARCTTLGASLAPGALSKRGLRFRSSYSSGDYYGPVNVGGSHYKDDPTDTHTPPPPKRQVVDWTVTLAQSVSGFIKSKLAANASKTSTLGIQSIIADQYRVESVGGSHDRTMATGAGQNPAQSARNSAGIPNYMPGSGNLEKALNLLSTSSSAVKVPVPSSPVQNPSTSPTTPEKSTFNEEPTDASVSQTVGTGPDEEL